MKGEGRCGRLGVVAAMITPPGAGVKDKKRAILEATLAVLRERGLSGLKMEEVVRRKAPFFVRLEEVLRRRLAWVQEWRGLWAAVAREAMDDPTPWLKGLHEHYLRRLEELLRSGQSEGAVRTGLSPRATAAVIAAMGCTPSLEVEAYLEHLMEVLRKGVEP